MELCDSPGRIPACQLVINDSGERWSIGIVITSAVNNVRFFPIPYQYSTNGLSEALLPEAPSVRLFSGGVPSMLRPIEYRSDNPWTEVVP